MIARLAPAPAPLARFRADAEAAAGGAIGRLGIAVSGGPDSLALLLLSREAFADIAAASVDHGLRSESAAEAQWVAEICGTLGIPHEVLGPPAVLDRRSGLQAGAREARYGLLGEWARRSACSHVATAHHADDQAETMMMRLARGAGLPGLAGIRRRRELGADASVVLIRPLLDWRRAELAALVEAAGLSAVDDPSNRSPRYDRTRSRALLAKAGAPPPSRIAAAAAHLADCEAALSWAADSAWALRAAIGAELELEPGGLPREIRRRLAKRAIETVRGFAGGWREDGLERLIAVLEAGGTATLAGVMATGGEIWRFRAAPPRRIRKS